VLAPIVTATASAPSGRRRPAPTLGAGERLRVVPWAEPAADPHGMHPSARYVELDWLGIIGPSRTSIGRIGNEQLDN
jgi:hypothetical protein